MTAKPKYNLNLFLIRVALVLCPMRIFATAQIPDLVIIENDTFSMFTNPLEPYLDSIGTRTLPEFKGSGSTACWRGYMAIWRVKNDSLFLERIQSCHKKEGHVDADLNLMFGNRYQKGRVHAFWYGGLIVLPHGKLKKYVHMGYGSLYEKYFLLEIDQGNLKEKLNLNHRQYKRFKKSQFTLYKQTEEYKDMVKEMQKKGFDDQKLIDSFLKEFVISYTTRILKKD